MNEFLKAFSIVFIAEMGDKSQLLAFAFATRYSLKTVLSGISFGILLNHGVAILLAMVISNFISIEVIKLVSAFVFIYFGLNSLILEYDEDEEEEKRTKLGPILTIALTFFLGEFGDKTQISAMTLAVMSKNPLLILVATVSSMILVSLFGIIVGKVLGKKIPEYTMKILAAFMFMGFGVLELKKAVPAQYLVPGNIAIFFLLLVSFVSFILYRNTKRRDVFYEKTIISLLRDCKNCTVHNPMCDISREVDRFTKLYLGENIPFIGNILSYIEGVRELSPKKYAKMREEILKNIN